ncbi:MAG: FecR domain-containing protein [Thermoguttaceae bacterium]
MKDINHLHELCEAAVEDRLTLEDRCELEQIVLADSEACDYYVDYVTEHLALTSYFEQHPEKWMTPPMETASHQSILRVQTKRNKKSQTHQSRQFSSVFYRGKSIILFALLGILCCLCSFPLVLKNKPTSTESFGKLNESGVCIWGEDSSAMRENKLIGNGNLNLKSGVAQIHFDHGAVLTLEAPTRIAILSRDRCVLQSGNVLAHISPEATGFTVETPAAKVTDIGTDFGIKYHEGQKADVHVFRGRVDVLPANQTETISATTGNWLQFENGKNIPKNPNDLFRATTKNGVSTSPPNEVFHCSTADDTSQEACIISGGDIEKLHSTFVSQSGIFTLVKNSHDSLPQWHRKGYFSIDFTRLAEKFYQDVQLELVFNPTGVGVSSKIPEVLEFTIYGLVDESLDHWNEETITWENAPGNFPGAAEVDPAVTTKISTFTIHRDTESCRIVISNDILDDFVKKDTNKKVTFIVVRNTQEIEGSGYSHGFANRHHPELPPPTLRFFDKPNKPKSINPTHQ